ncbi:Calcium-transporting ATPase 2 [Colletotrichum fructicola]|uniref:Calcium-transporting ATPase n=1 Tax=Colletotrichum fructicola (strain Nara gc5) TaxID=1213859 RepID=L2GAU1_COLFN|nr:Calcium-transporting ATPase 2 [Colletotrichum fructicola]KAF4476597.1 Calcium-transporting ATPase 2 [Colletotrichum fructicola Nara gc5]KAE9567132.1 Calcium-transporting ATPase 2 [Colletotrichum fructicola]KAF4419367.1 Calcium-transporting ATPase 2 [Colletotrichum fructicola]KAF4883160.1 Calcium-transporting ATPase 2 [Colletotrichum fructicola]KAF4904091.1 Calcium-transporting ATPase 2 [Colletotrichum fructicola]
MTDEITAAPRQQDSGPAGSSSYNHHFSKQQMGDDEKELDLRDDSNIQNNKFAFTPTQLHKLITARSLSALHAFGGLPGLAAGLRTDLAAGLSVDETDLDGAISFQEAVAAGEAHRSAEITPLPTAPTHEHGFKIDLDIGQHEEKGFTDRRRIFGENRLPKRKQKSFMRLAWIAFNDKLMFLLTLSATISLALGIYESVDAAESENKIQWVDGVTVVVAIFVIVFASAATDWQKNHRFAKLNERKEQRDVKVIRSGKTQNLSVYEVLVGDIMHIETGDVVAVDGVLVQGSGIQIDESTISGESELVHKNVPSESDIRNKKAHRSSATDPFILSGTTVSGGVGAYLVTSVGTNSTYGRTLMSLREDVDETPLQQKLGKLAKQLITFGAIAGIIFFLILFIRFLVELRSMSGSSSEKAETFFKLLILAVTVVVITVPEGLALAVTLALAFATTRMLKDKNLVRLIRSCEIMGNATCICSDKTGTLTQNNMTVVAGRIGISERFGDIAKVPSTTTDEADKGAVSDSGASDDNPRGLLDSLSDDVKTLMKNSVSLNSTAFESDDPKDPGFVGTSTETALLRFGRDFLAMGPLNEERANNEVADMFPFDASRKWMAVMAKVSEGKYRLLVKGAAEVVFDQCSFILNNPKTGLGVQVITADAREDMRSTIRDYASQMLRPIVVAYKDVYAAEAFEKPDDPDSIKFEKHFSDMTFVGVFGIRDPLRPEVPDSVRQCQEAGVFVRMVTGDNFLTAKAIAKECGIYSPGGLAMDGPTFRKLTPAQLDLVIPRLQVLARSSPEDKLLLVTHLKGMGETVAVTGDGTNDALALKAADVGFAMGIQGTEVSKEAASIILLDDNFASIVKALIWGRTVNIAVKKFLQFQFTINITAGTLTVVSELVGDSLFTIVQLLWINLIMDIFASLGLATDYPSHDFVRQRPEPRKAPIVTITMWKMILCQAVYQLAVMFTLHYAGESLWGIDTSDQNQVRSFQTMVFNIYVFMQFFNQHNCRRVDNRLNIWYQGVLRNPWFIGVQCATLAGQMIIIWKGGQAFDTRPLDGPQWGWSMLFGVLVIPLGAIIRQIPDEWVYAFFQMIKRAFMGTLYGMSKLLPSRWRKKAEEEAEDLGAMESWVLQTGAALLRPMNYEWGSTTPPPGGGLAGRVSSIPAAQREALARAARAGTGDNEIDVPQLIENARYAKVELSYGLEVHPGTPKEDPILLTSIGIDGKKCPPSQDPEILRYLQRPHSN